MWKTNLGAQLGGTYYVGLPCKNKCKVVRLLCKTSECGRLCKRRAASILCKVTAAAVSASKIGGQLDNQCCCLLDQYIHPISSSSYHEYIFTHGLSGDCSVMHVVVNADATHSCARVLRTSHLRDCSGFDNFCIWPGNFYTLAFLHHRQCLRQICMISGCSPFVPIYC